MEVNITSVSGPSRLLSITYSPDPVWHLGWVEVTYLLVVVLAALVVAVPVAKRWFCRDARCRCSDPCECRPCPIARNLLIVKLVAFLALPFAAGFMWGGGLTLAFWWGLAGAGGVAWSDVAVMLAGALAIPLVVQAASLSRKHVRRRRVASGMGIVLGGALQAFYLALYPAVGWLAPGLYVTGAADFLLARRVLRPTPLIPRTKGIMRVDPARNCEGASTNTHKSGHEGKMDPRRKGGNVPASLPSKIVPF